MIINEKLTKELLSLRQGIDIITNNNSVTDLQLENFLRSFEKARFILLNEVKLYNKNAEFDYEKIKTIDANYKAEFIDDILKIYVPEVMPSYKNLKTHTHKRILLNIAEITKKFAGKLGDEIFIYIKVFDKILGWDIDNKYIKPIINQRCVPIICNLLKNTKSIIYSKENTSLLYSAIVFVPFKTIFSKLQ